MREQVVIATKFGFDIDQATSQNRGGLNNRPGHIRQVMQALLQRLRTPVPPSCTAPKKTPGPSTGR